VKKNILYLIGGTLAIGGAAAIVSRFLWPNLPIPLYCLVSAGLCLIPTVVTLIWASRTTYQTPENQLLMVMGGTAFRMALVLAVGLLLFYTVSTFERRRFWIVLLVFYLLTLGLEIALLSGLRTEEKSKQT